MNGFDFLFAVDVICAVVALRRLRGATFTILANVCVMVRALSGIEEFGQPRSQGFITPGVFDPARLATATNIFAIVTILSVIAVLLPDSRPKVAGDRVELPPLPTWLLVALVVYVIALAAGSKTIFSGAYTDTGRSNFEMPTGGERFLFQGLLVYELYRRVRIGQMTQFGAFGLVMLSLIATDFSKGSTGGAIGFVLTAAFLFFGVKGVSWAQSLRVAAVIAAVAILSVFVRGTRATLYAEGGTAVDAVSQQVWDSEGTRSRTGEGLEASANGTQTATHVLECIYLYDAGYSRDWRSLYDPIIYTFQPKLVMDLLEKERAIEPAWELGKYFVHGGGIAIFGEMYWNGGYFCVALVTTVALLLAYFADTRKDRTFRWLIFYCMFAPSLGYGVGYGLTYLFRGTSNALIAIVVHKIFARKRHGGATDASASKVGDDEKLLPGLSGAGG